MQTRYFRSVILTAFVMAGCAVQPNLPQTGKAPSTPMADVQMDAQGSAVTRNFVIQSARSEPVEVKGVVASSSSVRDTRWWDVTNVNDGNHHSAWGPADDDKTPTLTLDLGADADVSALAIKMDQHPITFDVAAWKDGAWVTVATGVKPSRYQTMDFIDLPNHTTGKVKLTFHGIGETVGWRGEGENQTPVGAKLLVCEVKVYSDKEGMATPTPIPSKTPIVTPSTQPSVPPTEACTSVSIKGEFYSPTTPDNGPPSMFLDISARTTDGDVFGKARLSYATASTAFEGMVTNLEVVGDTLTLSGTATLIDGAGPASGQEFTVTVNITSRANGTFQGEVTGVSLNGMAQTLDMDRTITVQGTTADCQPDPLACVFIASSQEAMVFPGVSQMPVGQLTIHDLSSTSTITSGSVTFDVLDSTNNFSGSLTSANFEDATLTFSGTLANGGTFTSTALYFRDGENGGFTVTPVTFTAKDASGSVVFSFTDANPGLSPTETFSVTFGCDRQ
jgi:hypothetical protein